MGGAIIEINKNKNICLTEPAACHDGHHYEPDELHEYASQLLAAYDIRRVLGLFQFIPSLALSVPHTLSLLFRSFSVFLFYCQGTYFFSLALFSPTRSRFWLLKFDNHSCSTRPSPAAGLFVFPQLVTK
jgi:hypothetical protein